jgi:hypothetical protein
MNTVKAYYDGTAFVPIEPCPVMTKGTIVRLSIAAEMSADTETAKKLAAFRRLTSELHELNQTEPLSPEFDKIMSQRVDFSRELDL